MTLNLKQLEAFVAVADLGSFRRAAEKLNTTQPNISARIANLETQLGLSLMKRDAGSVRLSPKGKALLTQARNVLAAGEAFLTAAGNDALFDGVLRLGVTELVAHTWLRAFLVAMKAQFPNVLVELTVDLSAALSEALYTRDLDLTFQNSPFTRGTSGALFLESQPWIWVAAPPLYSDSTKVDDLLRHPILTHARGTMPFRQLAEHFASKTKTRARLVPSSNIGSCLQMTLDGLGVTCLPAPMVRDGLESGSLVRLKYPWTPENLRFEARYDAETAPTYLSQAGKIARKVLANEQAGLIDA